MADAFEGELLRRRALQVDVVALAGAKGLLHGLGVTRVDGLEGFEIDTFLVERESEHGKRLAAVVDDDLFALELFPGECVVRLAANEHESVALIDLCEVHERRALTALERAEVRRHRGLGHLNAAIVHTGENIARGFGDGKLGLEALGCQETAADGDQ